MDRDDTTRFSPGTGRVVALISLAAFINYVDRGNLATVGPLMQHQLGLSDTQLGILLSAFFWTYAPGQLPAGWLAERLNPRRLVAVGLAAWAVGTALTGFAENFAELLALRVVIGLAESSFWPTSFKILAGDEFAEQRDRANGYLMAGTSLGPAIGIFAGGLLMSWLGWRPMFFVIGGASLLWLWPWLSTPEPAKPQRAAAGSDVVPISAILRRRELWSSCVGQFCESYALYLVLSWLPTYLVSARGFSLEKMAQIGAIVYGLSAISSVLTGWVVQRWIAAGSDPSRVRKAALFIGFGGLVLCMATISLAGKVGSLIGFAGCGICTGLLFTTMAAAQQTLAGSRAAGRWMGIQNSFGNMAGVLAPVITGLIVDRTGSFSAAFMISAVLALIGIAAYGPMLGPIVPIRWVTKPVDATRNG